MDVVLHFTDDEGALQGGLVRVAPDERRGVAWIFVRTGMSEHDIEREVSLACSRSARRSWIYAGREAVV